MPCKIAIKQNLEEDIKLSAQRASGKSLSITKEVEKDINAAYKFNVIEFKQSGDYIDREITIPDALVDIYYDKEYKLETQEQREDALRIGEEFDEDYMFQLPNPKIVNDSIIELDNYLLNFMKSFGVKSKEFEELKSRLGVDALGATDVLNKLIWYTKNRNEETIPEEIGHMAVMLMGENHPDIKELLGEISSWSEYKEIESQYLPIYKNDKQVKLEAIGKLISKSLVKNYKAYGFDKSLLQKALNIISEFIDKILKSTNIWYALQYSSNLADHIAINILNGNKDYIGNLSVNTSKLDYNKALANNTFARSIIDFFTNKGLKLTGSIAIAGQGESIYRSTEEPIHDIDFTVDSEDEYNNIVDDLVKMNAVPYHFGWDNKQKDYKTLAWVIPAKGYTIEVLERDMDRGNGWITSYNVLDKDKNIIIPSSKNHIATDFFIYKNGKESRKNSIFKSFADIYFGKLTLSSIGNEERLFQREKDQKDYLLSKPIDVYDTHKGFRYLQTEELSSSAASTSTINKVKEAAKKMGVDIQELNEYAKNTGLDIKGINGIADVVRGVIGVAQGMENVTLTEEVVHIATAMLEQTNPKLITELISKIDRFAIYKKTYETYSKKYVLSNGKPDIRKIKKEAVDKLITEVIINNSEGITDFPELMKEENINLVKQWWNTIKDYIRGIYRKTNIDIFEQVGKQVISGDVGIRYYNKNMEGVDFVFNENPELKNIGTEQQYSAYLETIFPNSKVKNIVYHGTDADLTGGFSKEKRQPGTGSASPHMVGHIYTSFQRYSTIPYITGQGIKQSYTKWIIQYFEIKDLFKKFNKINESDSSWQNKPISTLILNKEKVEEFKKKYSIDPSVDVYEFLNDVYGINKNDSFNSWRLRKKEEFKNLDIKGKVPYAILLNITNPYIDRDKETIYTEQIKQAELNGNDGLLMYSNKDAFNSDVAVAFNDNQAHILGSIEDINGFKEFMKSAPKQFKGTEVFYQLANDLVDNFYNKVIDISNRMELFPESVTDKRHYTFDGKRVAKSVTEALKAKVNKRMGERTPAQKFIDEQKREWGSTGHIFLEQYITANLINKDGYRNVKFLDIPVSSTLSDKIKDEIQAFAKELISSYDENTRFIVEQKVVNENVKGLLASTIDFMAIEPITTKEGKKDIKVDILDWKFSSIDKTVQEDIASSKRKEWIAQMGEYTKILYSYGLKPSQLRKARMIPFIVNYENRIKGDSSSGIIPKTLEIGKLDSLTETNLYLLPVPINSETTGNIKIDSLLTALREQLEKLYKESVSPEDEFAKKLRLNQMNKAIRHLHLKLDFEPLVNVGKTFLNNAAKNFKEFENIDYSTLTKEEIEKKLGDLRSYKESALKFASLDDIYLSHISKEDMSKEDKMILLSLEQISSSTDRMLVKIEDIQKKFTVQLGLKEEFTTEETKTSILEAEVAIGGFAKTLLEGSKLSSKLISLASNLIMRARSKVNRAIAKEISEYEKILLPLEKEAKATGKKAFDLIGTMSESGLHLIKKIDGEFWKELLEAKSKKNKKFLIDNMDMVEYTKLVTEALTKNEKDLDAIQFSSDKDKDNEIRNFRKRSLRDSLDITRDTFNGYDGYHFNYLFNKVLKEEGHYSKEYKAMSDNAKNVWSFFVFLNKKAKDMGYLDRQGSSFFPLIEATILEKFSQTSNVGMQVKDFFADLYSVRVNEEQQYSKINKETGKVEKSIPKYFTRTDKKVEQLSRDLNKVGSLWIKSILEYENSRNLENTLLTLHAVEQAKGSLVVGPDGNVIFENGLPKISEAENKNADILGVIIEDYLYGLSEDASSMGNMNLNTLTSKMSKDSESVDKSVVSIKKGIKNADTLVRALAVGLKPLIGFANWAGGQFQSFIQAGNMYRFREFERNNIRVSVGNISTIERGLLDLIMPLNEDVSLEKRREMARKNTLLDYLGTWSFTDVMMITNSFPERKLQYANAMSFNENSMVVDGRIVNIRQYLKKQDRETKKGLTETERTILEKSYEDRVSALKETSNLLKTALIENGDVIIPNVSEDELAKYRVKIIEYGRTLNGQMSLDNKAGFRRDSILSSFMMFKTWIPKLVSVRALDIKKNIELDEWEYGRTRAFFKTIVFLSTKNIMQLRDIINGTDAGLKILDELLEAKKAEHYKKTGQILEITNEEFYDLMRTQITNQLKELKLLVGVLGIVIAAKAAEPPEDATDLERNRYKFLAKAINKVSDELTFYYDPRSMDSITKGSIVPSLGLLVKVEQLLVHLGRETKGHILDDDKMIDKAYPLKYFLNIIPGAAQFQTEILPYISPDLAKEMGIRVTTQARR